MNPIFPVSSACSAVVLAVAAAGSVSAAPQAVSTEEVLVRARTYVLDFIRSFSNVVAEERYVQASSVLPRVSGTGLDRNFNQPAPIRRVLTSDFLLVRRETNADWNTFRDVFEVDGRPVRDRSERLARLLIQPTTEAGDEALKIARESARYNLSGGGRTINNPLMVLSLLQPRFQERFRFTAGKPDKDFPSNVAVLEYREQARPTLLKRSGGENLPMIGRVWVDSGTGRILRTEMVVSGNDRVMTTFRFDERFQIAVPAEMHESYGAGRTSVEGHATYGQFRRFGVTTEEKIQ